MTDDPLETQVQSVLGRGDGSPPWATLAGLLRGGQRIRPRLVLALATHPTEASVRDAAALELVHLSTLVHDDIVDGGVHRRGVPTLNAAHGPDVALLVGNLVRDHALSLATPAALPLLNAASLDVNLGQLAETLARGRALGLGELLGIQYFKTARAFRHAGGIASLHRQQPLPEPALVALELAALAFQAVDDWLDLAPASGLTHKANARDAANGVPSLVRVRPSATLPALGEPESVTVAVAAAAASLGHGDVSVDQLPLARGQAAVLDYVRALALAAEQRAAGTGADATVAQLSARIEQRLLSFDAAGHRPSASSLR